MIRILFFSALTIMFCMALSGATIAAPVKAVTSPLLVGHKAVYDVKLLSAKTGSQIIGIGGKMTFSWKPSCDGWITDHSFKLRYDYADTDPSFIESHFTTFESKDHKELQFSSRRLRNGAEEEQIRGTATSQKAVFQFPKTMTMPFHTATIFPTKHTFELINAAQSRKKFVSQHVFDGSDLEGVMDISTVIGPQRMGAVNVKPETATIPKESAVDYTLLQGAAWPLRMAFFTQTEDQPNADYEMSLILHANGIISDMVIDYSDFTIRQKLVSLNKIPADQCGRAGKDG